MRHVLLLMILTGCVARAQEPASAAVPPPADPQVAQLLQALQAMQAHQGDSQATTITVQSLVQIISVALGIGGMGWVVPKIKIGGTDEVTTRKIDDIAATVARIDERTKTSQREIRGVRRTVHWHAQCLTAMAATSHVDLPTPPPDDDDDSDEPRPRR